MIDEEQKMVKRLTDDDILDILIVPDIVPIISKYLSWGSAPLGSPALRG